MHYRLVDYLLDLVQNSVEAGAGTVRLELRERADRVEALVRDDGRGMDGEVLKRALDPFYSDGTKHPGRRQGLGLPFLEQAVRALGGDYAIESARGKGTEVRFGYEASHVDAPPIGDVPGFMAGAMLLPGAFELELARHKETARGTFAWEARRSELFGALGLALGETADAGAAALLREYFASQEEGE